MSTATSTAPPATETHSITIGSTTWVCVQPHCDRIHHWYCSCT